MLTKKEEKSALFIDNNVVYKISLLEDGITIISYSINYEENIMIKSLHTYPLEWVFEKCSIVDFDELCQRFTSNLNVYIESCAKKEEKIYHEEYITSPYITTFNKCKKNTLSNCK